MADQTTELHFTGQARDAALWLLAETELSQHPMAPTIEAGDPVVVALPDWHGWSSGEDVILDTLRALSTRGYQLDLKSLAQADFETRWTCLWAVGMALGVFPPKQAPRWVPA